MMIASQAMFSDAEDSFIVDPMPTSEGSQFSLDTVPRQMPPR